MAPNPAAAKKEASGGYCRDCGKFNPYLDQNDRCGNCQRDFEEYDPKARLEREEKMGAWKRLQSRLVRSPMPMKWFYFYLYVRLTLGILNGFMGFFKNIISNVLFVPFLPVSMSAFIIFDYLIQLGILALIIFTFIQMFLLRKSGFMANRILLALSGLSFGSSLGSDIDGHMALASFVFAFIYSLVLILPNLIYFEKRRYLFDESAVVCPETA